jgi:hypothetical protein
VFGLAGRNASVSRYHGPIGLTPSFRLRYGLDSSANRCGTALIDALGHEFVDLGQELFREPHGNLLSRHQESVYLFGIQNGMREAEQRRAHPRGRQDQPVRSWASMVGYDD